VKSIAMLNPGAIRRFAIEVITASFLPPAS
jgi:hypothetical protein